MSEMAEDLDVLDETTDVVAEPAAGAPDLAPAEQSDQFSVSREEWEATQRYLQQTAPVMQQVMAQMQQAQQYEQQQYAQQNQPVLPQEFDPFDPESVRNFIQAHIEYGVQNGIQGALGPYEGMLSSVAQSQGEQEARSAMEQIRSELGEFDTDTAFLFASGLIDQVADPTQALRFGAQQAKAFEDRVRADERERYKKEMAELSQAPRETPVGSGSADVMEKVPSGRDRYEEVAERWLQRQSATNPFG